MSVLKPTQALHGQIKGFELLVSVHLHPREQSSGRLPDCRVLCTIQIEDWVPLFSADKTLNVFLSFCWRHSTTHSLKTSKETLLQWGTQFSLLHQTGQLHYIHISLLGSPSSGLYLIGKAATSNWCKKVHGRIDWMFATWHNILFMFDNAKCCIVNA